jgi:hypothetical protein
MVWSNTCVLVDKLFHTPAWLMFIYASLTKKKLGNKPSDAESLILISMFKQHTGTKLYVLDLNTVLTDI